MIHRTLALAAASFLLVASPAVASPAAGRGAAAVEERVRLAPHRAVYDLSLLSSRGMKGIESAQGRIALDFTGNACEGYALKFRQVTMLGSAETGVRTSDLRTSSHESGDGRSYRFRNDTVAREGAKSVDGTAERKDGAPLAVRLKTPRRQSVSLSGEAVFPNAQMKDIITAGRQGRNLLQMKLFDGSDDGRKVYETLVVIGREVKPGDAATLEEAARQDAVSNLSRWPVTLSYFVPGRADRTPMYALSFDVYDNGISRALKLDYGDFVLKGDLVRLEMLPDRGECSR